MALGRPKHRMHPSARHAWRIKGVLYFIISLIVPVAYYVFLGEGPRFIGPALIAATALFGIVTIVIIPEVRMIYWGYEIREEEVDIQYGLIVIKRSLIPMARIQHVDTEHGPILRLFNLATLSVSTAATTHKIPALKQETAQTLRGQIAGLARLSDEDV